jgi:tetratricopeptide (TPR) repeat protein
MNQHTILLLAANPAEMPRLNVDDEARDIRIALQQKGHGDAFKLEVWPAARPLDLLDGLGTLTPTVVHFSGHGGRGEDRRPVGARRDVGEPTSGDHGAMASHDAERHGLFFQGPNGQPQFVSAAAIGAAFAAAGSSVKLVVLNACYSELLADALLPHISCVVGVAGAIGDASARQFSVGFYGGLGQRRSVVQAFAEGRAAILLDDLPDHDRPQLRVRAGVDARELVVAAMPSATPGRHAFDRTAPSTIPSTRGEPRFIGRDAELTEIQARLEADGVVVISGAPGLGKSRLAREYAHGHAAAYPGGMFFVPFDQPPPVELAKLLRDTERPGAPGESHEDQCRRALRTIGSAGRALLVYDAIADERVLRDWLPADSQHCHVIATSTSAIWARAWSRTEVRPLRDEAAQSLVTSIVGNDADAHLVARIAARAAGITVELCASAAAAHERLCLGDNVEEVAAELSGPATSSFESAWALLSPEARLTLQVASSFATARFPASLVVDALQRIGRTPQAVNHAIDEARIRQLATRDGAYLQVHQLIAQFVRARAPLNGPVRRSLWQGFLSCARAFSEHPGDLERRALMLAHSLRLDDWATLVSDDCAWHEVGEAVVELGQFAQALPWFERAVAAKEQGDVHGRVDAQSLGSSLHQVGFCYAQQGQFAQALPWFERAVAASEKGDVHGRVDAQSLGISLGYVGGCYAQQGQFAQALSWFERAVAASEQGDVHGRVDAQSLGISLHHVGGCYAEQGEFAQAQPWFERAVAASEKGGVHGRVDAQSLGISLHQVGFCYAQQGQFTQALPWFERAVAAIEKGDVHGRVDAESLGRSLHQVGVCYSQRGQFALALPWFERAVAAKEKGDVHGRVDAQSLGISLCRVGDCYSQRGQFALALPRFERAVAAKEQGDVHGRIDPQSLGISLHQVGDCYSKQGQFAQAQPWFERAVAAQEQGDVHGRVDAQSVGRSLHQVGVCYAEQGQLAQALPWFERVVATKQQGDVHGRVDAESLGSSLCYVGDCYAEQGQFVQALPWFERAVAAKERGDVRGRVDVQSLGRSLRRVGECYERLGQSAEALPWFERAHAIENRRGVT